MIAKIVKGSSFGGVCRYVLDKKKDAELLSSNGVRTKDHLTIAESFEMQANMNPRVTKLVCHISLSFSAQDEPSNELMTQVANEYLQKMGFANTQFVIVKHNDKEQLLKYFSAKLFSITRFTVFANPNIIKLAHRLFY